MIVNEDGKSQICCDTCPASFEVYNPDAFAQMVREAKQEGWKILPVKPTGGDTSDLFGKAPRVAGQPQQRFSHQCPDCASKREERLL